MLRCKNHATYPEERPPRAKCGDCYKNYAEQYPTEFNQLLQQTRGELKALTSYYDMLQTAWAKAA